MAEMDLVPLIGSWTAADLWSPLHWTIYPTWILLAFLPRWKYTPALSLISPLINAVIYTLVVGRVMIFTESDEQVDLTTLAGVTAAFSNPSGVFVGWAHYLVFDILVGRGISMDAIERGVSNLFYGLVIVPCLFFTMMLGPIGFLLYSLAKTFVMPAQKEKKG